MSTTNDQKIDLKFAVITGLIILAAFSRLVPHMLNFSPLCAMGLFGAAYFSKKWQAIIIPLAATFLSDLFINNVIYAQYNPTFTWFYPGAYFQYIAYIVIIAVGFLIFKNKVTALKVTGGALSATVLFFLISNFGTWFSMSLYPKTFAGLMTCYAAGIPFINGSLDGSFVLGTLYGNLFYSGVLFGAYALIKRNVPSLRFA
jgi:multisubunit Na+/H+ antiporter MnhE subunit